MLKVLELIGAALDLYRKRRQQRKAEKAAHIVESRDSDGEYHFRGEEKW